jgi:hypothetical protein
MKISSPLFVTFDVGVDALVADNMLSFLLEHPSGNLIGAFAINELCFHMETESLVVMPTNAIIV